MSSVPQEPALPECPKCQLPMVPLASVIPGALDTSRAPNADAGQILDPVTDYPLWAPSYSYDPEFILVRIMLGLVTFVLDLAARVIYVVFAALGQGASMKRLQHILKRYPRSLYCSHCHYLQRRY